MRGLGLGFTNPVGTRGVWGMCLCLDCGGVEGSGWVVWTMEGGVLLCLCVIAIFHVFLWFTFCVLGVVNSTHGGRGEGAGNEVTSVYSLLPLTLRMTDWGSQILHKDEMMTYWSHDVGYLCIDCSACKSFDH